MDAQARRYREQAAELKKIANGTLYGAARDNMIETIAEYERMAAALDSVAPGDLAYPKHPGI